MDFEPMSFEEMQRTMQFLLDNQAKFDAGIARISEKTERLSEALIGLTGIVGRLAETQQEAVREAREADGRLGAYIQTVESHLNGVIEMFERHLREDHGHRPS